MTQRLFVYGSLKRGFPNEHINTGRRIEGAYRTASAYPLFLLGDGAVPCLVLSPGHGFQVIGELYRVTAADLRRIDLLERIGEAEGYERVSLQIQRFDIATPESFAALAYGKQECNIPQAGSRTGPLSEYLPEHTRHFHWLGATELE